MERVAILGAGGAGKSLLAAELAQRTGLPVVYLDVLFWRPGWTVPPPDEFRAALDAAVAGERWILDGNFLGAGRDARFDRLDTVIFLDLPRRTCFRRVLWRLVRDRGRSRPDLPVGCNEGLDVPLLRWIWAYARTDRPRVLTLLAGLDPRVDVHRLRSRAEVRRYLATL